MSKSEALNDSHNQTELMEQYYRFHAKIYNATRWSFLFGRKAVIKLIPQLPSVNRILEIGCGTGTNLIYLRDHFPDAEIYGLDISATMIETAKKSVAQRLPASAKPVNFILQMYDAPITNNQSYDLILFSYSLTMMNPGWQQAIDAAFSDLASGGLIAAADFHNSPLPFFKRWMGVNHVRMDGHLLPELARQFEAKEHHVNGAYGGVWQYFMFVGQKA